MDEPAHGEGAGKITAPPSPASFLCTPSSVLGAPVFPIGQNNVEASGRAPVDWGQTVRGQQRGRWEMDLQGEQEACLTERIVG